MSSFCIVSIEKPSYNQLFKEYAEFIRGRFLLFSLSSNFSILNAFPSALEFNNIITIYSQTYLPMQPPLISDHFAKYKNLPRHITIAGTSCKQPPLVSNRDHFFA